MTSNRVLVTGVSGFLAGRTIVQLLAQGHLVRVTFRSLGREAEVRNVLRDAGMVYGDWLQFVAADLMDDDGWPDAVAGMDYVLHFASPVMAGHVENEDDLIIPAREGALRVLRAARDGGVKRVLLTSAFHAVSWGHPHDDHVFTESDWTVLDGPGVDAHGKSKTLAERAAWDFMADEGGGLELATMLPVAVMGPIMGSAVSGSNHLIQTLFGGGMPGLVNIFMPIVDVRDVAAAPILAMTDPEAAGQRFLLSGGPAISLVDIASTIRAAVGAAAGRVPTQAIPDDVVRSAASSNPAFGSIVPDLGYQKQVSNQKARSVLGWVPRDPHEAIAAAAQSMVAKAAVQADDGVAPT